MMKTKTVTPEEFEKCVARFSKVAPQKHDAAEKNGIPVGAAEMIAAKDIRYYMGPVGASTAVGGGAPPAVEGFPGMSVYLVACPPDNGPMLHAHMHTLETFFCVDGRFEIAFGDRGENAIVLEPRDMVAVPPGVTRKFKNVSSQNGHLLVMIQGDPNQMGDILLTPEVGEEVVRRFGPGAKAGFEKTGIAFTAGV
jgi:uncharacterized RmlC-like cupin family protein